MLPFFFFFLKDFLIYLFIYLFISGCVGSPVRARAFSSRGKRGPLLIAVRGPPFIAVRGPLPTAAPPVAGHRLQTRRPSNRGPRAQPLRGTRDPPRPGLEPASPAPAGRPPTTAPPGKPYVAFFISQTFHFSPSPYHFQFSFEKVGPVKYKYQSSHFDYLNLCYTQTYEEIFFPTKFKEKQEIS